MGRTTILAPLKKILGLIWAQGTGYTCIKSSASQTFSWSCGDVGLHLWPVGQGFGTDAEVVGHPVGQVFDFHPQGGAAFHIHCNNLTDTWSVRRGVCKGDTTTLDTC